MNLIAELQIFALHAEVSNLWKCFQSETWDSGGSLRLGTYQSPCHQKIHLIVLPPEPLIVMAANDVH